MRRLSILLIALVVLVLVGTVGYAAQEHTSIGYGFEWTIDTITTVGAIPQPHDTAARVLRVVLELLGIVTLFYAFATVAELFVAGQLSGLFGERRDQRMIDTFADHYIICGFGRVGRQASRDLRAAGETHVVIDPNPENHEIARELQVPFIEAEASDDEVLKQAGVNRARAVLACIDSDADNIFVALTARELRADILIVARASAEDSEKKLLRAGADRVISPYKTSGAEMARIALHPQVGGTLQVADLRLEEIEVLPDCEGAGKAISEVRGNSIIVALQHPGRALETQPSTTEVLAAGDMLVAIGEPGDLERLEAVFQPQTR
jgi:voltage-gated potassium channel